MCGRPFFRKEGLHMRYALIGCGRVSRNHIAAAVDNGLEIAALCDIVPERAKESKNRFGLPEDTHIYADYREMLEAEKPQLAAIAVPSGSHADIAVDCIEAGCHVIIEKPIALSVADADRILAAQKHMGVKVCANHQNRFNAAVQQARSALLSGRFGRLLYATTSIHWYRDAAYYRGDDWRGTWAQDGGTLMNQCIHAIDLLRWMLGDALTEVVGFTDNQNHPYIEAEDVGVALLRAANGSYGVIDGTVNTYNTDFEETLTLFGEKGFVKIGGTCVNRIDAWQFADGSDTQSVVQAACGENPPNVYGFGHKSLYADMIDAIISDRAPYIDGEAGKRALETVLAIYKSSAEDRPVRLPLEACATTDFIGRFAK